MRKKGRFQAVEVERVVGIQNGNYFGVATFAWFRQTI